MDSWSTYLAPIVFFLAALCLAGFASFSAAFLSVSRGRIKKELEKKEDRRLLRILSWREDPVYTLSVLLTGEYLSLFILALASVWILIGFWSSPGIFWPLLFILMLLTVLLEISLRRVGSEKQIECLLIFYPFFLFFRVFLAPLAALTQLVSASLGNQKDSATEEEEDEKILADIHEEVEEMETEEKEMISAILEFREKEVSEIMVPRVDINAVESETPLNEALKLMVDSGHSRLPVFKERIDNIIGVLLEKDALKASLEGKDDYPVYNFTREPFFVPEGKKISELLPEMQKRKTQIALVVDEFGGLEGLVTMEDLLEEIVGEIRDEHDKESDIFEKIGENLFIVSGTISIRDLSELTGVELSSEDYDTLAGLLYGLFQHIPKEMEEMEYNGLKFRIEEVRGNRLVKIRVEVIQKYENGN